MEKIKQQLKALITIGEKVLLLGIGATALALSVTQFEDLKLLVRIVGLLCVVVGLAPMVWAYIKATWK